MAGKVNEVTDMTLMTGLTEEHEPVEMKDLNEMVVDLRQDIAALRASLLNNRRIDQNLYIEYDVKRGLRESNGKGVLTGLTEISDVVAFELVNGKKVPCDGRLYYQGINVWDIVNGLEGRKFGFEETIYLLLFGKLPTEEELRRCLRVSLGMQELTNRFCRDVVMKASNGNIMNALQICVLTL